MVVVECYLSQCLHLSLERCLEMDDAGSNLVVDGVGIEFGQ